MWRSCKRGNRTATPIEVCEVNGGGDDIPPVKHIWVSLTAEPGSFGADGLEISP